MPIRLVKSIALFVLVAVILSACQSPSTQTAQAPVGTKPPTASVTIAPTMLPGTSTPESAPTDGPLAPAANDRFAGVDPKGQKIVYWHSQTGKGQAALEKIAREFNSGNTEGITVEAVSQGSEAAIFEKIQAGMNSKDLPGLLDASQDHAAVYQFSGMLEDMNGLVTSAKWGLTTQEFNDFPGGVMAQDIHTVFLGARLGFPVSRSMVLLYANQDWLKELGLDQVPQSPEQFKTAACRAAKQPFSKSSTQDDAPAGLLIPKDTAFFIPLIYAFGGDIFGTANNFYTLGSDPAVHAAAFVQELVKEGCARLSPDSDSVRELFRAGQALFVPGSSDDLGVVAADTKFSWTASPLPHSAPEPVLTVMGPSLSIPKSSPEKELAAWLFVKYLASPAVQAEWASASGSLALRGAAGLALGEYFTQNPTYKTAFDLIKYAKPEPPVPGSGLVQAKLEGALATLTISPYPDPRAVLMQLNQDVNQELQDLLAKKK